MAKNIKPKGPEFTRFMAPLLEVLKSLGGSGRPAEAKQADLAKFNLSETEKGQKESLSPEEVLRVFQSVQRTFPKKSKTSEEDEAEEVPYADDYRTQLLSVLKRLSPSGFERLGQRLLRENGFQQVKVTGSSGDGGIDGNGVVQVNPFVSFQILFQCKRYKDAVGAGHVRDFRGAMMGRAV